MKKVNKITAGIITALLLAISFIQPGHTTLATAIKYEQTEKFVCKKEQNNHMINQHGIEAHYHLPLKM